MRFEVGEDKRGVSKLTTLFTADALEQLPTPREYNRVSPDLSGKLRLGIGPKRGFYCDKELFFGGSPSRRCFGKVAGTVVEFQLLTQFGISDFDLDTPVRAVTGLVKRRIRN